MEISLTKTQLRLLCDLVYVGNWVINAPRGDARITPYDEVESKVFFAAAKEGMSELADVTSYGTIPSQPYVDGGIHEVIMDYEDSMFFSILSEELDDLIREYYTEFSANGIDNVEIKGIDNK